MNPQMGALRTRYDHEVAAQLLEEAKTSPPAKATPEEADTQGRALFRARWLPWLTGDSPGPIPEAALSGRPAAWTSNLLPQQP